MTKQPVSTVELKDAILHMMVERFGDRALDWETCERAFALANFEIKQAAVFAQRKETSK
jgi:hypothetical protein